MISTVTASDHILERVSVYALTSDRLNSLKEAVTDFVKRSEVPDINSLGTWRWIEAILTGQSKDELWWALREERVVCYFITSISQELDGTWSIFIDQGWGDPSLSPETKKRYLQTVVDDAFQRGAQLAEFASYRDGFVRWLTEDWKPAATLYELRKSNG